MKRYVIRVERLLNECGWTVTFRRLPPKKTVPEQIEEAIKSEREAIVQILTSATRSYAYNRLDPDLSSRGLKNFINLDEVLRCIRERKGKP